jgi:hypothetical protein
MLELNVTCDRHDITETMLIRHLTTMHTLCATFSANVNVNYRLPIKVKLHTTVFVLLDISESK